MLWTALEGDCQCHLFLEASISTKLYGVRGAWYKQIGRHRGKCRTFRRGVMFCMTLSSLLYACCKAPLRCMIVQSRCTSPSGQRPSLVRHNEGCRVHSTYWFSTRCPNTNSHHDVRCSHITGKAPFGCLPHCCIAADLMCQQCCPTGNLNTI